MSEFCQIPAMERSQLSVNFDFSSSAICHKRQTSHDDDRYKDTDWDDDDFEGNNNRSSERTLNSQPESSKRARMDDNDQNNWTAMFDMLIHFGIQNSHCNVPFNHVIRIGDGNVIIPLGAWLSQQLELERSHSLPPERRQKLQVLIPWTLCLLIWYIDPMFDRCFESEIPSTLHFGKINHHYQKFEENFRTEYQWWRLTPFISI